MLRNRQCSCCGTWDYPIGPSYLRPEVKEAIDSAIANSIGHREISIPFIDLSQAEYEYFSRLINDFQGAFRKFAQIANFK